MEVEELIDALLAGKISKQEAVERFKTIENLGFARIDLNREKRTGFPEAVFGEGKTLKQLQGIVGAFWERKKPLLITRIDEDSAKALLRDYPEFSHNQTARALFWKPETVKKTAKGYVSVLCAGTSDLPIAEEAVVTAEHMGCTIERFFDVGVAGVHRLLENIEAIKASSALVVVAGMDGVLPSLVGGLVDKPVIAVPTSVGYGAHFEGLASLLTMLNSCAAGVTVVNIDNGFGAGYAAALIHRNQNRDI